MLLKCFSKMNVKFYVRKSCTESKIIICILKDHAKMLRLTTELTTSVNHCDAKSQRAKKTIIGYEQLCDTLEHLKMDVLKQIREYKLHGVTEWPVFKQYIKSIFTQSQQNGVMNAIQGPEVIYQIKCSTFFSLQECLNISLRQLVNTRSYRRI